VLCALVAGAGLVAFVAVRPEQPWLLWLTAGLVILAVDGTVRTNPQWLADNSFSGLVYTILPALAVVGSGLFVDQALNGYARPATAAGAALFVGVTAFGEYHTVDYGSRLYGAMRLVLAVGTYLAAFAVYSVVFSMDLSLWESALAIGVTSTALSIELLRESRLLGSSSVLVGIAIGVTLAELRIALYFFPTDGLLAGAITIIGFYLATGIVHHLLDHDLEPATLSEYLLVAAVGTAAVVLTRSVL
jgi:hypothetical protein